jgi:hypothetical protein
LKRKQLMELAIINGTYRPANQRSLLQRVLFFYTFLNLCILKKHHVLWHPYNCRRQCNRPVVRRISIRWHIKWHIYNISNNNSMLVCVCLFSFYMNIVKDQIHRHLCHRIRRLCNMAIIVQCMHHRRRRCIRRRFVVLCFSFNYFKYSDTIHTRELSSTTTAQYEPTWHCCRRRCHFIIATSSE